MCLYHPRSGLCQYWNNIVPRGITYLRLTGMKLGYVLNFGEALMKDGITRIVYGEL
jgi:hypothetical protein